MAYPVKQEAGADMVTDTAGERRNTDRRRRDRRKPGTRVNKAAPRGSLLKMIGAQGLAISAAVIAISFLAAAQLGMQIPLTAVAFQVGALITFALLMALGSLELRLIEIRLELMMLNGGMRQSDRREGERRG